MKYLISLALIAMLFVMVSGFIGADSLPTTITVGEQLIVFTVGPSSLDFPTAIAGQTSTATTPITFAVTSGNVDVLFSVTGTTGNALFSGIEVRNSTTLDPFAIIIGQSTINYCVLSEGLCTYPNTPSWDAQLFIPAGTRAASYSGAIVYTVTSTGPV